MPEKLELKDICEFDSANDFNNGINPYNHIWRRYFAFSIDISIYLAIFNLIFKGILKNAIGLVYALTSVILVMLMYIVINSFLVSKYQASIGKMVLGFRVKNLDGTNLTYAESLKRTVSSIRYGHGWSIPIYNIIRIIKSANASKKGDKQWNTDYYYELKDLKIKRVVVTIFVFIILTIVEINSTFLSHRITNKGDISFEQHIENVNDLMDSYRTRNPWGVWEMMGEDGLWNLHWNGETFTYEKQFESVEAFFASDASSYRKVLLDGDKVIGLDYIVNLGDNDIYYDGMYGSDFVEIYCLIFSSKDYNYLSEIFDFSLRGKLKEVQSQLEGEWDFGDWVVTRTLKLGDSYKIENGKRIEKKSSEVSDEECVIYLKIRKK